MFVNILYCNFGRNYGQYLLFQLCVIATVSDLVKSSSCKEDITYIRDDAFFNSRLTEGKIRTHIGVENQAKCAVKCNRDSNCISFFYKKNSGTCQINSVIYLSTSGSVADEGFVYFRENMECPVPPSIPNSRPQFDVNSAPNTIGTVLEYTCSVGYTPERSVNCQVDGTWTRMACTEDCPSPPDIPNGNQLFVASTASRSQGTSLQYTCKTGFVPDNDLTTITCQVSATWTNIVCKRPDCPSPPNIANSNEQFVRSAVSTVYGTTLQYQCKSGFVAENGVTTITCGVGATWTSLVCKRPDCPSPPVIANSNEQFVRSTASTVYGATLQYQCKPGFVAENGITAVTCGVDATWPSIICKRPDCPSPPNIANSNEQFVRSAVSTVYGTTLQYQCKSGFVAENGVTTITCGVGATWTSLVCKRPDCPSPPVIANSHAQFVRSTASTVYRATLQYQCKPEFVAENGITTVTCGLGASWTSIVCKLIRSCSDVKTCNSQYGDGEYWIYPARYGTTKAKIYCHNMNSGAIEYVTLNTVNIAYKPPKSSWTCLGDIYPGESKGGGETRYNKIRVNIQTMEVDRIDRTFAYTAFGKSSDYGHAEDCYTPHFNNRGACGPKGTFNIDTTGTGLIVDPTLSFPVKGWRFWGQAVRNADGTKIDLLCGGWCGECAPNKEMLLIIGSTAPPRASAVMPTCS